MVCWISVSVRSNIVILNLLLLRMVIIHKMRFPKVLRKFGLYSEATGQAKRILGLMIVYPSVLVNIPIDQAPPLFTDEFALLNMKMAVKA